MNRRAVVVVCLGVLFTAVPAVEAQTPAPSPATVEALASTLQPLLDERANAFRAHNEAAFVATVDPRDPGFVDRQRALVRNSRDVPFERYALRVETEDVGNMATPADRAKWGADVAVLHVVEEYEFTGGYDANSPVVEDLFLVFARTNGKYLIAADDVTDAAGLQSARHAWESDHVRVRESAHFLALFPANQERNVDQTLSESEAGLRTVLDAWSPKWNEKVAIEIPRDADSLAVRLLATFPLDNFVAFAGASLDQQGLRYRWTGNRVYIQPANFLPQGASERRSTMAHELIHVASREVSGVYVPGWLEEGIAQVIGENTSAVGLGPMRDAIREGRFTGRPPEDWQFLVGGPDRIYQSYVESYLLVREIEKLAGREGVIRLYLAIGDGGRIGPGTADYRMDLAVRKALGMSLDELLRKWADDVRANRLR